MIYRTYDMLDKINDYIYLYPVLWQFLLQLFSVALAQFSNESSLNN